MASVYYIYLTIESRTFLHSIYQLSLPSLTLQYFLMGCTQSKDKGSKTNKMSGQKPNTVPSTIKPTTSNVNPPSQLPNQPPSNLQIAQPTISSSIDQPSNLVVGNQPNAPAFLSGIQPNNSLVRPENLSAANPIGVVPSNLQQPPTNTVMGHTDGTIGSNFQVYRPLDQTSTIRDKGEFQQNVPKSSQNGQLPREAQNPSRLLAPAAGSNINHSNDGLLKISAGDQSLISIPQKSVLPPPDYFKASNNEPVYNQVSNFQNRVSEASNNQYSSATGNFGTNNPTSNYVPPAVVGQASNRSRIDLSWAAQIDDEGYTEDNKQTIKVPPICVRIG